jgi:hypothetical protein
MLSRRVSYYASWCLVMLLSSVPVAATSRVVPYPGNVFAIHLSAPKTIAHLGETIRFHLSITNLTSRDVQVFSTPLRFLCPLTIVDSSGAVLTPNAGVIGRTDPRYRLHFAPKQTIDFGLVSLYEFGYALDRPGKYTITAALKAEAFMATTPSDIFAIDGAVSSGPIELTVDG